VRFVATSDLHVHPFRVGSANGGRDRLQDGLSAMRQSLDVARREGCTWVFCGDLKMPKNVWPQDALNGVINLLYEYDDVEKLMVPGNHDGLFGEFGSGLAPFRSLTTVHDKPFVGDCLAVWPYGGKRLGELPEFLKRAEQMQRPRILLAHLMFRGVALGPTDAHLPQAGSPVDAFGIGDVFDLAVVGDIHKGQIYLSTSAKRPTRSWKSFTDYGQRVYAGGVVPIRGPRPGKSAWAGEVIYPGSPYQQSWGEVNEWPKGSVVVDVATGEVTLAVSTSPRFRSFEIETMDELRGMADTLASEDRIQLEGDIVRLHVADSVLSDRGAAKIVELIRSESKARELRAIPRRQKLVGAAAPVAAVGMKNEELFAGWAEKHPLAGVTKETVVRSMLELALDDSEGGE
jgi:DNA repair exonuclease SbcCD nuclease subunit